MNAHTPFDANQDWTNPYCQNSSNDPMVDALLGNAYHVVRTVYCNLGNLKLIYDFLNKYGMVLGVQSETELKAMTTSASYVRLYGFDNTNKRVVTDYLYVEGDRTGVIPDDPTATGSWILVATTNSSGGGKASPPYIPYTYNNGSAIGDETTIPVPAGTVGVPMIVIDGYTNLVGYGFTYDASTLTVTLAQPLEPGDEVHLFLTGTPAVPDNPNVSDWVQINWLYNGGYALGGEQVIAIPYTFESVPAIYKNGERYYAGLADKSYTVDAANQHILLTEPLETNDRLIVTIGGESTTLVMSDRTVQEVARSANVKDSEVILSSNTTQYLNDMKVVYDVVSQKSYGLPVLPTNVYINKVENGQLTYSPGNITVDLLPVPESGSDVLNQLSQPNGYTLIPSVATQASAAQIAEWRVLGDVRGWGAKLDGESDDSQAIRDAFSETNDIVIPAEKTVYVGSTIVTPRDFTITGKNSIIRGASGITILQLPQYNGAVTGTIISGLHFAGVGCTAIGVETPAVRGSGYYRYVPRLSVRDCHFYWELSYGIDGNLIFADIFNCSFGYLGTDGTTSGGLNSIRNRATDGVANNPNFNRIRKCYFYKGSGATTHINGYRGGHLSIEDCDFEQAGQCISLDNVGNVNIERCWFELCNGLNGIIKITNCPTSATITKCKLYRCQGDDGATITYDSNNVAYLEVSKCDFEQQGNYPLLNTGVAGVGAIKVPPINNVRWFENRVINADPASAYTTAYQYRGPGSARAVVRYNMATSTIINSSVPVTLNKQATGSFTLTFTDMLGVTATNQLGISATAYNGYVRIGDGGGNNNNQILVNAYKGDTHVLFDSTDVTLVIY